MSMQPYQPGPGWGAQVAAPPAVRDQRGLAVRSVESTVAWVVAVCTFGYMLPWAVAASRGKTNSGGIAVLNLLAGWTVVGWIAALAMACSAHHTLANQSVVVHVSGHQTPPPGWYPDGTGLRYWDGHRWTDATARPDDGAPSY